PPPARDGADVVQLRLELVAVAEVLDDAAPGLVGDPRLDRIGHAGGGVAHLGGEPPLDLGALAGELARRLGHPEVASRWKAWTSRAIWLMSPTQRVATTTAATSRSSRATTHRWTTMSPIVAAAIAATAATDR